MKKSIDPYYFSKKKRLFDIFFSIIFILLSTIIWALLLPILLISIGNPIIFKQKRAGIKKKPFTILKLRTMVKNAPQIKNKLKKKNQAPEPMFKIFDDPRFIGIGKFLSKTGLDETPQFINILKGDMSIIGPRPLPIDESKKLSSTWDFRFSVKPGLFSEWTLSKNRHQSLTSWKKLDRKTLQSGGWHYDISLLQKSIKIAIKTII